MASKPIRATLYMLLAMACFAAMSVFIRLAADKVHTLEVVFFRNFFALILLLPLLLRRGVVLLKTEKWQLYGLRAAFNYCGMWAGFTAITLIPLADATALSFTAPLFVTIGAVLVLGEVVRARRIGAIIVGFIGVLVVLQPDAQGLSVGTSLALIHAVLLAATTLIVKRLTDTEPVQAIVVWMAVLSTPISLLPALAVWEWPDLATLTALICLAAAGTLGHLCWTKACSLTDVSQLQPLEFVRLPLAALLGYLIFLESPQAGIWLGGAIIFLSSAYITRREVTLARQNRS